jgi:3-hydroxymyristoyl/3-hydroxydecanoyl-(acyl carrier protein) dehydratase
MFASVAHDERGVTATVDPAYAATATSGHFPDEPLLPGSALLELMVRAARALPATPARLAAVERAVFRRRVRPSERIVVSARPDGARHVETIVRADDDDAATGRLCFEPVP